MAAKIPRKIMKMFGQNAGGTEMGVFGSFANGAPEYSSDVEDIQSLPAWLNGWYAAIVGDANPAIQDFNALLYVLAYQLTYLMQEGIAEWNAETEYFIGSAVQDGTGNFYISLTDNNLGNAVSNPLSWRNTRSALMESVDPGTQSPLTLDATDSGKTLLVTTLNGALTINLPTPIPNFRIIIKDVSGKAQLYPISIVRPGSETIEGLAATYSCNANYGAWQFSCDGSNWWLV